MEHTGFEPVASTMRMLRAPNCANAPKQTRADNGSRTRLSGLGSQCSTDEPYLHITIIALLDFDVKLLIIINLRKKRNVCSRKGRDLKNRDCQKKGRMII